MPAQRPELLGAEAEWEAWSAVRGKAREDCWKAYVEEDCCQLFHFIWFDLA